MQSTIQQWCGIGEITIPLSATVASTGLALTGATGKVKVNSLLKTYSDSANNVVELGGGSYTITLTAVDDYGEDGIPQDIVITWNPSTASPVCVVVQMTKNQLAGASTTQGLGDDLLLPAAAPGAANGLPKLDDNLAIAAYPAGTIPGTVGSTHTTNQITFEAATGVILDDNADTDNGLIGAGVIFATTPLRGYMGIVLASEYVSAGIQLLTFGDGLGNNLLPKAPAEGDAAYLVPAKSLATLASQSIFPRLQAVVTSATVDNTTTIFKAADLIGQDPDKIRGMFCTFTDPTSSDNVPCSRIVSDFNDADGTITLASAMPVDVEIDTQFNLAGYSGT